MSGTFMLTYLDSHDNHIENFLLIHFDIIKKYFNINLIIKDC